MKKWIGMIIAILLVAGGVLYYKIQPILPELTVKVILEKLEESNYTLILDSDEIELTDEQRELLHMMLDSFLYEVKGSRIDGQMAYVLMDVTFIDMKQLIYEQRAVILKTAMENFWSVLDDVLNGRTEQRVMMILLDILNNPNIEKPMITKAIEIPLQKEKFYWVPQITEEWIKSVFEVEEIGSLLDQLQKQ